MEFSLLEDAWGAPPKRSGSLADKKPEARAKHLSASRSKRLDRSWRALLREGFSRDDGGLAEGVDDDGLAEEAAPRRARAGAAEREKDPSKTWRSRGMMRKVTRDSPAPEKAPAPPIQFVSPLLSAGGGGGARCDAPGYWESVPRGSELVAASEPWVPMPPSARIDAAWALTRTDGAPPQADGAPPQADGAPPPAPPPEPAEAIERAGDAGDAGDAGLDDDYWTDEGDEYERAKESARSVARSRLTLGEGRDLSRVGPGAHEVSGLEARSVSGTNDIFLYVFSGLLLLFLVEQAVQLGAAIGAARAAHIPSFGAAAGCFKIS